MILVFWHSVYAKYVIIRWTPAVKLCTHYWWFLCVCTVCIFLFYVVYLSLNCRVSESVEKNRRQLQSVTDRIRLAQARVDKIKGSKKATKVTQRPPSYHALIHYTHFTVLRRTILYFQVILLASVSRFSPVPSTQPQIDLRITHPFSAGLQTPPHSRGLDIGYRINFGRLMRRPSK